MTINLTLEELEIVTSALLELWSKFPNDLRKLRGNPEAKKQLHDIIALEKKLGDVRDKYRKNKNSNIERNLTNWEG